MFFFKHQRRCNRAPIFKSFKLDDDKFFFIQSKEGTLAEALPSIPVEGYSAMAAGEASKRPFNPMVPLELRHPRMLMYAGAERVLLQDWNFVILI